MQAAAEAAGRDDPAAAAALLRRVVGLQERALGQNSPQLAPSLNNLAMMLERQGDTVEAERCYRRAYDLARRAAGRDDPLAVAARANLVEFLRAVGKLDGARADVDEDTLLASASPAADDRDPAPPPAVAAPVSEPVPRPAPPSRPAPATRPAPSPAPKRPARGQTPPPAPPSEPRRASVTPQRTGTRAWMLAGLAAVLAAAAFFLIGRSDTPPVPLGNPAPDRVVTPPAVSADAGGPPTPAPPPMAPPATRPPEAAPSAPVAGEPVAREPVAREPSAPPPAVAPSPRATPPTPATAPEIAAEASLCQTLTRSPGAWRCDALPADGSADSVYYYTRVKSPRDVVVRHRWTYAGQPVQTVTLRVAANAQEGFRTFSRQRVTGRAGEWQVALITADGTVVDTQRFTVSRTRN